MNTLETPQTRNELQANRPQHKRTVECLLRIMSLLIWSWSPKIFSWNCQGAASKSFIRTAKWFISKYHPNIFCLVETKTSGCNADSLCAKLGFDKWARVEALGFSGGIWILWSNSVQIEVLHSHPQFVHMAITDQLGRFWNLSVVYGSPTLHLRRRLWSSLKRTKLHVNHPWLIAGDFNAIANDYECSSPSNPGNHKNADFRNWIFSEALLDLGFSGPNFTWRRGKEEGTFKGARLDRALCSLDWIDRMHDTKVTHLTAIGSDHSPILVEFDTKVKQGGNDFMFQGAWTRHRDFLDFTRQNWDKEGSVWQNKDTMAVKFKDWNRTVFGNIHYRKNNLLRRLDGIHKKMDQACHAGLVRLERKIKKELEDTLQQEEILWFQQAREDWIASGDRNTSFYHAATKCKKAKIGRHNFLDMVGIPW
ncbi:uncharacterized protein LOC116033172 [Ipomoea triloba]|uniref:uncharacterized protein LOC116033172 n=1 Tax=Ipomoea triloba TaxID=35885 RepID=UPI00125DED67|nr:uncharacterized protein LOC116033172 [Ipomoea triloba]